MKNNLLELVMIISKQTLYAIILLCLGQSLLFADEISGQSMHKVHISIDMKRASLPEIFSAIEDNTEFTFTYGNDVRAIRTKLTLDYKNVAVAKILKNITQHTGVEFLQINETITAKGNQKAMKRIKNSFRIEYELDKTITGKVTDENGEGLPGVNVFVKDTNVGVVTDINGNYKLNVPDDVTILVFSYVGYITEEVDITGRTIVDFTLTADISTLSEIVVVGYGTQKKSDLTGAVSTVKTDNLPVATTTSVEQLLSAQAPGVQVTQASAQPGGGVDIVIRGRPSVRAGNNPLFVIDGFPVTGGGVEPGSSQQFPNAGNRSPLNDINPNDIESIEILKDASATAIYGARAANGVILVTTKRGKSGTPKVEYSGSYTIQEVKEIPDIMNATEYTRFVRDLEIDRVLRGVDSNADGQTIAYAPYSGVPAPSDLVSRLDAAGLLRYTEDDIASIGEGTNFYDLLTQNGFVNQHNISVSGGNDKTKYLTSFNYFDQEGVVRTSELTRYSLRFNLDQEINDRLSLGLSAMASQVRNRNLPLGGDFNERAAPLVAALSFSPDVPAFDENGIGGYGQHTIGPQIWQNPLGLALENTDNTITNRVLVNAFAKVDIIEGLSATARFGIDRSTGERNAYLPTTTLVGNQRGGVAEKRFRAKEDYLVNFVVNYSKTFDKHLFSALAGYEYQQFNESQFGSSNNSFISNGLLFNALGQGTGTPVVSSEKFQDEIASYFGRINYNYDERYLLTFTIRRDGSPKFGENNRWGTFPSVSAKWRIINEAFFPSTDLFTDLGLRVGYGQTGNSNIGANAQAVFQANTGFIFGAGGDQRFNTGVRQTQLANPDLTWETTTELNIGLDFGLFNNRLQGTFEYFSKEVSDLLATRDLAAFLPINRVAANIGITESKGWELSLNSVNIDNGSFKWTTNFNISRFRDKWKQRDPDNIIPVHLKEDDFVRPIYTHEVVGILQIGDEVPDAQPALEPGQLILRDWNGIDSEGNLTGQPDGLITDADLVFQGTEDPGYVYGIGNTISYKGFDLNFFFQGMADRIRFDELRNDYAGFNGPGFLTPVVHGPGALREASNSWTPDNPDTYLPTASFTSTGNVGDLFVEKASFLRLRNVTLGYTLPQDLTQNVFQKARVFIDLQNVLVITDYTGIDPEFDNAGAFPNQQSYTLGVNLTF
ncbi:TonB-dependent receptor [Fulvivirgaceae bacterium BMA10]|uniref:TonB-dependent receptor n=1 Tax=Splendidivirga corallicola TaxID=3051826 RepID=A0ABT8KZY6_9BACT|nr:TonB-dependent receptor [Fulvivirgaceae bacterium BMA10]